ncbi:queuosine 5'-phosphate N-glycosylase/hydrolase-like [Lytechinus pictus]|uniref:queuosine 5'-phosphate N-glycosylase/hydrolase-like n=1 Tax=Lytechinus pictus TaxID=7653 RepID=UPI0030BA12C2
MTKVKGHLHICNNNRQNLNLISNKNDNFFRVPQGLNYFGVLSYSDALKKRLVNETKLFTPGERLEVEIRGCSIWAVELILQEMRKIREGDPSKDDMILNSIIIDFYLWTYCKDHREDMEHIPIHKIRSIYY